MWKNLSFFASIYAVLLLFPSTAAANYTAWDYAPDIGNDPFSPYPSIKNADGSNITAENLRGARLFGYWGCNEERRRLINGAYDDFHKLADQLELWNKIDWKGDAAQDFFAVDDDEKNIHIPDDTRKEIKSIFEALQQVYNGNPVGWQPPWLSWRHLWIEVRCSNGKKGDNEPDPEDTCGDYQEEPKKGCRNGNQPSGGAKTRLQAFSDPDPPRSRYWHKYSRITFCGDFFKLQTLDIGVENGMRSGKKKNLEMYDNQARVMFHEITHLDYFMSAPKVSPYISDLEALYTYKKSLDWWECYGPYGARMLRTYMDPTSVDNSYTAYYTQRNADNYAWFAMAIWVKNKIGEYPNQPAVGRAYIKPSNPPRDANTKEEPAFKRAGSSTRAKSPNGAKKKSSRRGQGLDSPLLLEERTDPGGTDTPDEPAYDVPGCGDKMQQKGADAISASISSMYANPTSVPNPGNGNSPGNGGSGKSSAQVAIASYVNPLADKAAWTRMIDYASDKVSVLVANVVNGPDSQTDKDWKGVIDRAAANGKTVIGYVRTGYLGVSQQKYKTRLDSTDLGDWIAQIQEDVDSWYRLYPSSIKGIFFDEGWNDCGPNNKYAEVYAYINRYTKIKHPGAFTVLNPGATMPKCFEHSADTLLTFEQPYSVYDKSYEGNGWKSDDIRKIWHIIYDVPKDQVARIAGLAVERGAGLIQITNDVAPNPYDNLPDDSYLSTLINELPGGEPLIESTASWPSGGSASTPSGLTVVSSEYTSAKLMWNSASGAKGYNIYAQGVFVASVPSDQLSTTVGGYQPGSSSSFTVAAVGGGGSVSGQSSSVAVSFKSLPGGKTIRNQKAVASAGETTITVDVLVPYAFVRVFIWDSLECDWDKGGGWPITYEGSTYICAKYLIEGEKFFKYNGKKAEKEDAPWAWELVKDMGDGGFGGPKRQGYTYSWTIPIGSSTIDTTRIVVQGQGIGPYTNIFTPEPQGYDCDGSILCSTPGLLAWCDKAVNGLERTDGPHYLTSTGDSLDAGNCYGDGIRYCGVFLEGTDCIASGNMMWEAYQNIRDIGGCKKCGAYKYSDKCKVKIDYVSTCKPAGS